MTANGALTVKPPRPTWEEAEGSPLPLGIRWIEEERAFNFAVHSEDAESVTLLLYSPADPVNPLLRLQLDFLHNKSGRIWHCRIPVTKLGTARYYAYSVSGETIPQLHSFDPQKVLLDPYAKCIFFPPGFDRNLAMREGSNAGSAPPVLQEDDCVPEKSPLALPEQVLARGYFLVWRRPHVDLSSDSHSLAFCLHGASQGDDDIYAMINAYWVALEFHVQEGTAQECKRIVDIALPSPDDFSDDGIPLERTKYPLAPRSIVVLCRSTRSYTQ